MYIRKGDTVVVLSGADSGKSGRVIAVFPKKGTVLVERVRLVKRHTKPGKMNRQGGIVQMENPVSVANLMLFCLKCEKGVRIGMKMLEGGARMRVCRACGQEVEVK